MRRIGPAASEKKLFENVDDGRRTGDGSGELITAATHKIVSYRGLSRIFRGIMPSTVKV